MEKQHTKTPIKFIAISLCTCKRPKMLEKALKSLETISIPENIIIEVLVVDNDKNQSAKEIVFAYQKNSRYEVHYHTEPKRGLSFARNKVLEEAAKLGASHILFFDDDEYLATDCLKSHIDFYNENENAIIISGPTINVFAPNTPNYIMKNIVFTQTTTKQHKNIRKTCAAGNVFFPISLYTKFGIKFSEEYVFMGGEDGDFFGRASKAGFTIVWNSNAIIYEEVPKARTTPEYIFKKCYYNGYAGAFNRIKEKKKRQISYAIKNIFLLFINCLLLIPSIIMGRAVFLNMLGICLRTKGKIDGSLSSKPYNFYEKIYGE